MFLIYTLFKIPDFKAMMKVFLGNYPLKGIEISTPTKEATGLCKF
jgi:hypothetical protein